MERQTLRLAVALLVALPMLHACGGGGSGSEGPTADTRPPVITLIGASTVNHEQGTTYADPGATAIDDVSGSVPVTVTGTVGDVAGTYTLDYTATDAAGNTASARRTVIVADTTAPTIRLVGEATVLHTAGSPYLDAGATATDVVDGPVNVVTTGTVGDAVGNYTLTYTASDQAGNAAAATRTVIVGAASGAGPNDLLVLYEGAVDPIWDRGISAFDEAIDFAECSNDGGAGCPSISWELVTDSERGDVLEIAHTAAGNLAGVFIASSAAIDLSDFSGGAIEFDIRVVSGDSNITMKLDCFYPCTSGDQSLGSIGAAGWQTVVVPISRLVSGGLDLGRVNTGIVIWATDAASTVFRIDNVRFTGIADGALPPTGGTVPGDFTITAYGAGSISDTINPDSYRCVYDFGHFIYNAGVVRPEIDFCDTATGIPSGTPQRRSPQLTGPAATKPTATHKWWGSVSFLGEMRIGDPASAAYITPDPITARVSERGLRLMGIPAGLTATADGFGYPIPDPFAEVFDGIAVGNSDYSNLDAYLKDHSDGSVTVEWQAAGTAVMEATLVHGSPYVYVKAFRGDPVVRTLRSDGPEKGVFFQQGNSLGVWTNVAGNHNNFLITGEGSTTFDNVNGDVITVRNAAKELTLAYLPQTDGIPADSMTTFLASYARNVVAAVEIGYSVDRGNNVVTVSHAYKDAAGAPVVTLAGMHPLHWKNSGQATSGYQVRSARGTIKFSATDSFSYELQSVGVLPSLPTISGSFDPAELQRLVSEFVSRGPAAWNSETNTYWAGKNYGKVADLIAIADANGMATEAAQLLDWLRSELSDWFEADTNGTLDVKKYFVYDEEWSTLLGLEEAFASHQQLNDHHFHYGYFVRAAAEVCRMDPDWCGDAGYGPMIELLIRDFAGGRDDPMFPYLRNFDPANGFSWASGSLNFVRGNNNESTSEAANAYGAIILYGLLTGREDLIERGMYLHASTAAAYWEYWNNIDGYRNAGATEDNFPPGYDRITTSIIWGDGSAFATWFSGAVAHILGIQGLPSNPLILHVGQYADYMADYVALGLSQSSNIRPSGLPSDQWPDLWWNLWAMSDADAAIADYNTVGQYTPEAGETRAHTFHWIHTFSRLGTLKTGTGQLTADYPAALAFERDGITTYVVYNFDPEDRLVTFSDGQLVNASGSGFTVVTN
jgi:endoglucanase Acf2